MPLEVHNLAQTPITSHVFSPDRQRQSQLVMFFYPNDDDLTIHIVTELAVSLNSNDVQIYSRSGQEWVPTDTLSEVR
jgi:actin related protein 2/3 complex subunit 1A/1B